MKLRRIANIQSVMQDLNKLAPLVAPFFGAAWTPQTVAQLTQLIVQTVLPNATQTQRTAIFQYLSSRQGDVTTAQGINKNLIRILGNKHLLRLSQNSLKALDQQVSQGYVAQLRILKLPRPLYVHIRQRYGSFWRQLVLPARVYTGPLAGQIIGLRLPFGWGYSYTDNLLRKLGATRSILDSICPADVIGTMLRAVLQRSTRAAPDSSICTVPHNMVYQLRTQSVTSFMKKYNRTLWHARRQHQGCTLRLQDRPVRCAFCAHKTCPAAGLEAEE